MTPSVLLYGILLSILLGASAHWIERALRSLGLPGRWVWAAALGGAVVAPFVVPLVPAVAPVTPAAPLGLEALQSLGPARPGGLTVPGSIMGVLAGPLPWVWRGLSILVGATFLWVSFQLWRGTRRWMSRQVGDQDVLVSEGLGPAVLGLLRPRIVLPPWALALEPEELAMVLLHEREHKDARDPVLLALGILATVSCPLNPGLWWMLRRLRLAVEADCDARVLRHGVPGRRYAALLLDVAQGARPVFPLAAALAEGGRNSLERRLAMMRWSVRKNRVVVAVGATALGGLFLFLACEAPTPPAAESEPAAAAQDQAVQVTAPGTSADEATGSAPKVVIRGPDSATPLFVVDGVVVDNGVEADLVDLDPNRIKSISVLKGEAALAQWGDRGKNGVILITTKTKAEMEAGGETLNGEKGDEPAIRPETSSPHADAEPGEPAPSILLRGGAGPDAPAPLYIIDGVIVTDPSVVESIDKNDIESIEVVRGKAAEALWGARAANGVVQIRTKK